jgi:two-component system, chemotaxis family, protein-glutamate methylesterase/glutaminase
MSTPRRPEPRSSAAPMIVTLRLGCIDIADKANFRRMGNPETAAMIRVLLADDDQPFLDALSPLIERQPELAVVGQALDGLAAIELADELSPDAVVIDLHMPRLDGVSAVARLRRDHPSMCVIALTGDEAPALHRAVTEAGADAVLVKDEFVDVLVDRLAAARAGIS